MRLFGSPTNRPLLRGPEGGVSTQHAREEIASGDYALAMTSRRRRERGQSLVEMALAMIFLVWLIAVIIDMGSALFTWIALRDAAQEGALYGSVNPTDNATIKLRVVTSSDRPLDLAQAYSDGTLEINPTIGGSACTGGAITVLVRYQYTPIIPLVSAIWPTIPIRATVTDTILLPEC